MKPLLLAMLAALLCAVPFYSQAQCSSPPTLIGVVTPPPGTAAGDYEATHLVVGSEYYTDAAATIDRIPVELECAHWIRTRNADANATDANFLEFTVLEPVDVWVLYDMRVANQPERSPPDWLTSGFAYQHLVLDVDAASSGPSDIDMEFVAYRNHFPAGTVTLGANGAAGADFDGDQGIETSQYIVAVTRPTAPLPAPGCASPPTLISSIQPPVLDCDPPCVYSRANLFAGSQYYADRGATHTLAQLPPEVACADWLKTQNDDKANQEVGLPSFTTSVPSVVYVAYDTRIALHQRVVPDWLTTQFAYTGRIVDIDEPNPDQEFVLYAKSVPAGTVALGGNRATPAVPGGEQSSYVVAVVPDSDGDGVADTIDNCPATPNPTQTDSEADGVGDACDPCTLVDDPAQSGWDPLGTPPPDFGVCILPMETGLQFTGLEARYDHLFVVDLGNFPLRPEYDVVITPTSPGIIGFFQTIACNVDPADEVIFDVASPNDGFTTFGNDSVKIWKAFQSVASRQGTFCIAGIPGDPGSSAIFDLSLDVLATVPAADTRDYDPIAGTFTAASPDFGAEGSNHRWIFPGTVGLGQCQPFPLTDGLQNPGETNAGPAAASYEPDAVPVQTDVYDCCTWTYESVDGVRAIPAVVEFPIGTPTVPLADGDGDFYPDRCDVCPAVQDIQFEEDGDLRGDACDTHPLDPLRCADTDEDGCDDCSSGAFDPANDGNPFVPGVTCIPVPEPTTTGGLLAGIALLGVLARRPTRRLAPGRAAGSYAVRLGGPSSAPPRRHM